MLGKTKEKKGGRAMQHISTHLRGSLIKAAVPVIAGLLEIKPGLLDEALRLRARPMLANDPLNPYHRFPQEKRDGSFRWINAPHPTLRLVQRAIHDRILTPRYRGSEIAHGFISGRSIVTNASFHLGLDEEQPELLDPQFALNFDLKDAFPTVNAERVIKIFEGLVDCELALILGYLATWEERLPQGAPSSPMLLNHALWEFDQELAELIAKYGMVVTRYVDDHTISSAEKIPVEVFENARCLVERHGFAIHPQKTWWQSARHQALEITGLKLVDGQVRLPKETRRNFRTRLHFASRVTEKELEDEKFAKWLIGTCIGMVGLTYNVQGDLTSDLWGPYRRLLVMGRMPSLAQLKNRKWRNLVQEFEYDYVY